MINRFVLKMELMRSFKSMVLWGIALGITLFLIIIIYPLVEDIYEQIPKELLDIYGSFGGIPANVIEYFATEGGMLLQLFSAIYVTVLGYNTITRDEKEHAGDIIFTLPVSRRTFYLTKLISVYINIILFSIILFLFTIIGIVSIDSSDLSGLIIFMLLNTVTLLMIASISFALASIMKGNSKLVSILIPFLLYIFQIISSITENKWLTKFKYLTPFSFSDPVEILKDFQGLEWIIFTVFLVITIVSIIFSITKYNKKEIAL